LKQSSTKIAELIRKVAKNTEAHVIGLSIGAHIAIALAKSYPKLVSSLLLSGYHTYAALFQPILSLGLYQLRKYFIRGTKMPPFLLSQCRQILRIVCSPLDTDKRRVDTPTLILVALLDDALKDAKRLKICTSWGSDIVKLIIAPKLHHLWYAHDAGVVAELVIAWIEKIKRGGEICWPADFIEVLGC
jgi:pimeloyl-ACP methyl ester carboxylesterase